MCGVAGFIASKSIQDRIKLPDMLELLDHRGVDATGVAYYEKRANPKLRVSLKKAALKDEVLGMVGKRAEIISSQFYKGVGIFTFLDIDLKVDDANIRPLWWEIDSNPDLCVHSFGPSITIIKDEGSSVDIQSRHKIEVGEKCTHGIGHVRLATESTEDVNLAHPFTSYLMPGLSMVHNGSFTNYFKMRRTLETKGVRFKTTNDSEMAANFLAYQMGEKGKSLEEALHMGLDTFDGVFTILAATDTEVGALRDNLGMKPLVYHETGDGGVLFGTEQISITPVISDVYANEMDPGEVIIWKV